MGTLERTSTTMKILIIVLVASLTWQGVVGFLGALLAAIAGAGAIGGLTYYDYSGQMRAAKRRTIGEKDQVWETFPLTQERIKAYYIPGLERLLRGRAPDETIKTLKGTLIHAGWNGRPWLCETPCTETETGKNVTIFELFDGPFIDYIFAQFKRRDVRPWYTVAVNNGIDKCDPDMLTLPAVPGECEEM